MLIMRSPLLLDRHVTAKLCLWHKAIRNQKGVLVMGQTNICVKQVAESRLRNGICSKDAITWLITIEYQKVTLYGTP